MNVQKVYNANRDDDEDWSRRERDPLAALPHRGRQMSWWHHRHIPKMGKRFVEQGGDGVPAGLGNKHGKNTRDVPRFGALVVR